MASIMEYLDWRGDIPFSFDPFNETDNLLLCQIAYVHYENIVPGMDTDDTVSVCDAAKKYLELHPTPRSEVRSGSVQLLQKMAQTVRFKDVRIGGYVSSFSREKDEQMSAVTFFLPDGTAYVSFRGTDNSLSGWKEDLNLSFLSDTPGQQHAAAYLSFYLKNTGCPLRVGGHSKGGNYAVYASAFCDAGIRERIQVIYNNDGPGFLEDVLARPEYQEIVPKVRSIIPEGSLFGLLLYHSYPHHIIKSTGKGLFQHDMMTWQVLGSSLEAAPGLTQTSVFLEKTVRDWVENINYEDRQAFVDSLFEILTSGGADTLRELNQSSLKEKMDLFKSFREMDTRDQKLFVQTFGDLLKSGWNTLYEGISETGKGLPSRLLGTGLEMLIPSKETKDAPQHMVKTKDVSNASEKEEKNGPDPV